MATSFTRFKNTTAQAARELEVPFASFDDGCNSPASNAAGIGITTDHPDLPAEDSPGMIGYQWTLEDQFEAVRLPQVSQVIGGVGLTEETDWPSSGGVEGNGGLGDQYVVGVSNPANIVDPNIPGGSIPDPTSEPVVTGTANLVTLAAGWTLV